MAAGGASVKSEIVFERYYAAVLDNPRLPGEGAMAYLVRIAEIAAKVDAGALPKPAKDWPAPRLPYRDDSEDTNWTPQ